METNFQSNPSFGMNFNPPENDVIHLLGGSRALGRPFNYAVR